MFLGAISVQFKTTKTNLQSVYIYRNIVNIGPYSSINWFLPPQDNTIRH